MNPVTPRTQSSLPGLVGRSDVELVVVSNPETPDRTLAIKGLGPSPLPWLVESARLAEQMGAGDLAYPCNTAHYFLPRAPAELAPRVPLVDMIHETVAEVAASDLRRVGLLATTGTTSTRLYQEAFEAKAVSVVVPQHLEGAPSAPDLEGEGRVTRDAYQRHGVALDGSLDPARLPAVVDLVVGLLGEQEGLVMEAIRGAFGVKAGFTSGVAAALAAEAGRRLVSRGAQALVLGCTELPLVLTGRATELDGRAVRLVDPTSVVAARLMAVDRRILQLAGRDLRKQLAGLLLDEERDDSVALPQESLAALLGVRRPSLNKVLRELEREGVVGLSYRCVDIADRAALVRAAGRAAS